MKKPGHTHLAMPSYHSTTFWLSELQEALQLTSDGHFGALLYSE